MRQLSEETRAEATAGLSGREAEQLIDMLLKIKDNMTRLGKGSPDGERAGRDASLAGGNNE